MSIPFQVLVKRSTLLKYGLLGMAAGVGLAVWGFASDQSMPERAALQKVEGQITKATQITTKRKRGGESVRYQLEVKGAAPEPITITIPQKDISETQVRSLLPTRIVAEFDAENDVYVLTSNGRPVLTYENSVKSRQEGNKGLEVMGALLSAFSAFVAAIGFWWTKRKVNKEIAAWEAEQATHTQHSQHTPPTAA
jgi:hypothetical protein